MCLICKSSITLTFVPKKNIDDNMLNMELYGKTLNDHLNYYYYGRKAWLAVYSFIILLGSIIQMILVICYIYKNINEPDNKKNL